MPDDDAAEVSSDPIEEALSLARELPARAVAAVFQRYGKPLAAQLPSVEPGDPHARIVMEDGRAAILRLVQVRTPVDVIANDWFVLETGGAERLAIPGPLFASALAALALGAARNPR